MAGDDEVCQIEDSFAARFLPLGHLTERAPQALILKVFDAFEEVADDCDYALLRLDDDADILCRVARSGDNLDPFVDFIRLTVCEIMERI